MQRQIALLFQSIAQLEVQGNQLKQIDLNSAFTQLSRGKESFTLTELQELYDSPHLGFVFRQMDRDNDQVVTFKEYLKLVISFQIYMQTKSSSKSRDVNRLIQHELHAAEEIQKQLTQFKCNPNQLFRLITGHQFISQQALVDFLSKSFIKLKSHELHALHTYLDRNRDGFITIQDFQELFATQGKVIVLKQNQEQKLVNALYEMMYLNKQLEEKKVQLEHYDDYDLNAFFNLFDTFKQRKITRLDFELCCMEMGIKIKKQQIVLFFQRYSEDNSFLTYQDFTNAFAKDPIMRVVQKISTRTMNKFKDLIGAILLTEEKIQMVKERLAENSEFSIELAFQFIDKLKLGAITIDEFREVFEQHKIQITNQEIESLMQIYTKGESRVSYGSFISGMNPLY